MEIYFVLQKYKIKSLDWDNKIHITIIPLILKIFGILILSTTNGIGLNTRYLEYLKNLN